MSQEQSIPRNAVAGRPQIRIRFEQLRRSPGLRVIGLPELIGLSIAALLAVIAIFAYFYFLVPAHSRLTSAQTQRDLLQGQLRALQTSMRMDDDAAATVAKINASLEDFESNWLAAQATGRMSLYAELNGLIRSNGLRNTSGPAYSPLAPIGTKSQANPSATAESQANAKWQSIYPGISVSVTVEGAYQSVRHFVRDIETSRQFLIINAVELESVTPTGATASEVPARTSAAPARTPSARGGRVLPSVTPPTAGKGTLVSLRLDMATYFRRAGGESAAAQ